MAPAREATVDLQTAADRLGVHYQTAYRWVRDGRLPATRVGGRYAIRTEDITALHRVRSAPEGPPAPRPARLRRRAVAMEEALVEGDEPSARSLAATLVAEGAPLIDVIEVVIVPALVHVGQAWSDGRLPVWQEHRAAAIVERVLGDLATNPRGRRRGDALVAAVEGDTHSLPTTMAALVLRDDRWRVHHLGADLPSTEIEAFARVQELDVAVLTVTEMASAVVAEATATRLRSAGVPTVVGRPGRTLRELVTRVRAAKGADPTAQQSTPGGGSPVT